MMKNWSRIALASVLVLMLGAVVANATTSRVRSLANVGDYISDDSAVHRWYSTLVSFANQVNAEMGDWTTQSLSDSRGLGWNFAMGEDAKWGTYRVTLNEASLNDPGFWIGNPFYQVHGPSEIGGPFVGDLEFPYEDVPMNRWDIAGAWELGETFAIGVSITQSKWFVEDETTDFASDNSWLVFGAGATWTNNENMVIDALVNFGTAGGETTTAGPTSLEWDSGTAFELGARMFYDWKDDITLVPVVDFATSDYSLTSSPAALTPPNGQKTTDIMVGLGLNMDVNQDNMLVFALEWMNRTVEFSNADTTAADIAEVSQNFMPTIRLALESSITSWLTTRIGAAKYIGSLKAETNGGEEIKVSAGHPWDYPEMNGFDWFLGAGFNFSEWTVDLELAHETPFGLGYWLTGYSGAWDAGGFGPVGRISAVYNY